LTSSKNPPASNDFGLLSSRLPANSSHSTEPSPMRFSQSLARALRPSRPGRPCPPQTRRRSTSYGHRVQGVDALPASTQSFRWQDPAIHNAMREVLALLRGERVVNGIERHRSFVATPCGPQPACHGGSRRINISSSIAAGARRPVPVRQNASPRHPVGQTEFFD